MGDTPNYLASRAMEYFIDSVADSDIDTTRAALIEIKRLCDKELANMDEIEADKKLNPHFYT